MQENYVDHLLFNGANMRSKVLVAYRYDCFFNILHELTHCLQTLSKQSDPKSWSAEHDASRIALVWMHQIVKENINNVATVYFSDAGREEEMYLYVLERVRAARRITGTADSAEQSCGKVEQEHLQGYEKWRESFGLCEPVQADAFEFAGDNITATDYLKYRIGLEQFVHECLLEKPTATTLLKSYFENRTGPVHQFDMNQVLQMKEIKIAPEAYIM